MVDEVLLISGGISGCICMVPGVFRVTSSPSGKLPIHLNTIQNTHSRTTQAHTASGRSWGACGMGQIPSRAEHDANAESIAFMLGHKPRQKQQRKQLEK